MTDASNFYSILGLKKNATFEEIRRAYHEAARRLHPDVNIQPGATESFLRVQHAFEVLSDPGRRIAYDASRAAAPETLLPITNNILYSRSSLPKIGEPQLIYTYLEFAALENHSDSQVTPRLNLCLVLDRSTSMRGERMDMVKQAAIELTRQLHADDILSIIIFGDRADVLVPAARRGDRTDIETQIRMIHPAGGTEMLRGLEAGFFETRRHLSDERVNHMVLLTDGRTYGDEAGCLRLAEQAAAIGVGISGLGIGEEWNDTFLDSLANLTGGGSLYISRPQDVLRFLKEKINGLGQTYAKQVTLTLDLGPGIELKDVYRLRPEPLPMPTGLVLHLGNVEKDASLAVILEFIVAPIPGPLQQILLASGQVEYDVPSSVPPHHQTRVHLVRPTSSIAAIEMPPRPIFDAMSRITLYRLQDKVRQDIADGQIQQASRRLEHLATHLLAQGHKNLAHTALMEAERIQLNQVLSEKGEKQIKYGTRSLLLPALVPGGYT